MSMFDDESYNDGVNTGKRIAVGCMVASLIVLVILGVTFTMNSRNRRNTAHNTTLATASADENVKTEYEKSGEKRTSDELSFWNMYDEDEDQSVALPEEKKTEEKRAEEPEEKKDPFKEKAEKLKEEERKASQSENAPGENKFNIKASGEDPEYVAVNRVLNLTDTVPEGFSMKGDRLVYSKDGRVTSHFGIDVSKYNGAISWNRVKNQGVEFAMLRVGARGYSTGQVLLDEMLKANLDGCAAYGIDVGLYFFSQAVTREEAIEEANYCLASIAGRPIRYPIVFDSEVIANDSYRTENLTQETLTDIAMAFCETIKQYGFTPMIAGTKEQLARRLDLARLQSYELWLFDVGETTEFPYRYSMRQYTNEGKLDGIETPVSYDLCLISYADR